MARSWIERLLLNWNIGWLRFDIGWWLVLWLECLVLWLTGWHSHRRFAVSSWLNCLNISAWWCGLDTWSLWKGLSWNEGLGLWNWTELLLSIVSNMLFVLSLLLSQLSVDFLSEIIHELSHSFLNFLVNQVSNSLAHICWNLIKVVHLLLRLHKLLNWCHNLLWTSLNNFSLVSWLVA